MIKVTVEPNVSASLHNLITAAELCDPDGRTIGYFHPVSSDPDKGGRPITSPLSREELERRRQQRTGKSLGEILRELQLP